MANLDVIRTLTLRAKAEGFAQAQAGVENLGQAYDTSARRQLSMEKALQSLERRFIDNAKQMQDFQRVQEQLNRVTSQFPDLQDRANSVLGAAASKLGILTGVTGTTTATFGKFLNTINQVSINVDAANASFGAFQSGFAGVNARMGSFTNNLSLVQGGLVTTKATLGQIGNQFGALTASIPTQPLANFGAQAQQTGTQVTQFGNTSKLTRYELINLSRQIQDVGVGLASGQALFTVAIQQGTQIADVFAASGVSLGSFARQVVNMIGPMKLLAIAAAAVAAAGVLIYSNWRNVELQFLSLSERLDTPIAKLRALASAAAVRGISTEEFTKGMEGFGDNVDRAQKGLGSLAQLLRLNGQSAGNLESSLEKVADLVANAATGQQKYRILQEAGLPPTAEWVRLLSQGGKNLAQSAADAAKFDQAGEDMARRARDFDEAWAKAWQNFKTNAQNAVVTVAGFFSTLIDKATDMLTKNMLRFRSEAELGRQALGAGIGTQLNLQEAANFYDRIRSAGEKTQQNTTKIVADTRDLLGLESQRIALLGNLATTQDAVRAKEIQIQQAGLAGVNLKKTEIQQLLEIARLTDIAAKSQARVSALGDAATVTEKYAAALDQLRVKLADTTITQTEYNRAALQLHPVIKSINDAIGELGSSMAKAFIEGADAAQAFNQSLKAIASTAASEAIKNLIKGDITGAAISGGIAAVAGIASIFGGKSQGQQQSEQQAQQAQSAALAQIAQNLQAAQTALLDTSTRQGAVAELIAKQSAELQQAFAEISKGLLNTATANALIASLQQKHNAEMVALQEKFVKQSIEVLRTELGQPLTDLQQRIMRVVEAFRGAGEGAQAFGDVGKALQDMFRTAAGLKAPLSDTQKAMQNLIEEAGTLQQALFDLGVAASDAARIAGEELTAALTRLRQSFSDDLISRINALAGADWINQITDLVSTVQQLQADAAALGNIDPNLIRDFFVLSAQDIINQNRLTGNSFIALVNATGLADAGLHEFIETVEDGAKAFTRSAEQIAAAIQNFEDQLFVLQQDQTTLAGQLAVFDLQAQRQREQEIAAGGQALAALEALQAQQRLNIIDEFNRRQAEEQARALQAQLDAQRRAAEEQQRILDEARQFLEGQIRRIQEFVSHFLSSSGSPLSPAQQLATAQAAFSTQYAQALSGNRDALSGITGYAQDAIDAARRYYGSGMQGQTIISNIISQLQALPAQVSPEQFIVNAIDQSAIDITTSVADANADLIQALATGNLAAFATALNAHFATLDTNVNGLLDFNEFTTGLHGMASDASLATMFKTLDTDNSGSLTKLELIRAGTDSLPPIKTDTGHLPAVDTNTLNATTQLLALAQISNNTQSTANSTASMASLQSSANSTLSAMNATLSSNNSLLSQINSGTAAILNETAFQSTTTQAIRSAQNVMLSRWGATSADSYGGISIGGPFAQGGYVEGRGTATSDSVLAMLSTGEGVINASRMAELGGRSAINRINAGLPVANDNISYEIRRMSEMLSSALEQIADLQAAANREIAINTQATRVQTQELNREQRFTARKGAA
jgi:tail length tape measure protein